MEVHLEKKRSNLQNKMEVTILEPQLLGKWEDPRALCLLPTALQVGLPGGRGGQRAKKTPGSIPELELGPYSNKGSVH